MEFYSQEMEVAGGKILRVKLYEATIEWFGNKKDVLVLSLEDEVLLGMNLLCANKLTIDQGIVTIE